MKNQVKQEEKVAQLTDDVSERRPHLSMLPSRKKVEHKTTNKEFAAEDGNFRAACAKVGVEPTTRQASKFRNRKGIAWKGGK